MARVEDCPGFETFGADVKATCEKLGISRRELALKVRQSYVASNASWDPRGEKMKAPASRELSFAC